MTVRALKLDSDNNLVVTAGRLQLTSDGPAIVQAIRLALQMFMGEWYLDLLEGMPWWQEILVKNPDTAQIRRRFADRILGVAGVSKLDSLVLSFDRPTRVLTVRFKVSTDVGLLSDTVTLRTP